MARGNASVSVTVDDLASAVLRKINTGIREVDKSSQALAKTAAKTDSAGGFKGFAASTERMSASLKGIASGNAFREISHGFSSMGDNARKAAGSLVAIAPALAAITSAASVAGLVRLTTEWASFASKLGNSAKLIGSPIERLSALENGARRAGVASGEMTGTLEKLQGTLQDAAFGRNAGAAVLFQKLGISLRDSNGQVRRATEIMPELADKLARIKNPTVAMAAAQTLLGGTSKELLLYLLQGSQAMRDSEEAAKRHGLATEGQSVAAHKLQTAEADLAQSVEGFGNSIAEKVAPALTDMFEWLSRIIDANRDWIAQDIGAYVKRFSEWLRSIDWKSVWKGIEDTAAKIKTVVDALGGWQTASEAIFALWAGSKVTGMIASIGNVATAFRGLLSIPGVIALLGYMGFKGAAAGGADVAQHAASGQIPTGFDENGNPSGYRQATPAEMGRTEYVPLGTRLNDLIHGRGWYAHEHAQERPGAPGTAFSTDVPTAGRALLDTIADRESAGDYSRLYGGGHMQSWANVPNEGALITSGPNAGLKSTAWGRYQFRNETWDRVSRHLGLTDKSPANQDKAAWYLAQEAYARNRPGRDLAADLRSNDPVIQAGIARALSGVWTSLPGGIEQAGGDASFVQRLRKHSAEESGISPMRTSTPTPSLDMTPALRPTSVPLDPANPASGTVTINLTGSLPPGVTHTATATGNGISLNNQVPVQTAFPTYGY